MEDRNIIVYYSDFTDYIDSNSCYENFYYKGKCFY